MIDVLIVTRSADLLASCLEHLAKQTVAHRVFVADNSEPGEALVPPAVPGGRPVMVPMGGNVGFGRAVNRIAALGTGEAIVLVNDDVDVVPEFLERLVAPLADPAVGMVAGLTLVPGTDARIDTFGIRADVTLQAFARGRGRSPADEHGVLLGPCGAAAAYRRSAWEAVGGLDEALFFYAEDLDLALRLRSRGWRAAPSAGARGVHLGGATAGAVSGFQRRHSAFGRAFVLRRYGILRGRHAPRALLVEALTIAYGILTGRTLTPVTARVAGWRAGAGRRLAVAPDAVDRTLTMGDVLRALRRGG